MAQTTDLPIIRKEVRSNGPTLFLVEDRGQFLVSTRFESKGRRKRLEDAQALFDRILSGAR